MTAKLFEAALGIASPWYINGVEFNVANRTAEEMPATACGAPASRFGVASPKGPLLRPSRSPLRRRRFAPDPRLARPSGVFNCGF